MSQASNFSLTLAQDACKLMPIQSCHLLEGWLSFSAFLISTRMSIYGLFSFSKLPFRIIEQLFILTIVIFYRVVFSFIQIILIFIGE